MKLSNKIELHFLTIVLFFVSFLTGYFKYMAIIFAIVFIHELGHVSMAKIFKRKVNKIVLLPFGGMTQLEGFISEDIFEDLLIAIGGILFQIILGVIFHILYENSFIDEKMFFFFRSYNKLIIIFNLLPICPLDGYKICKLISELLMPYKSAFKVSCFLSVVVLSVVALSNIELFMDNSLILIFLVCTIGKEIRMQRLMSAKFLVERVNYDFYYSRIDVPSLKKMFKNRINYIQNIHEREYLMHYFTKECD